MSALCSSGREAVAYSRACLVLFGGVVGQSLAKGSLSRMATSFPGDGNQLRQSVLQARRRRRGGAEEGYTDTPVHS